MILRMESSLTRTLKTKDRLCSGTTKYDANAPQKRDRKAGPRRREYIAEIMEVSREAQEGILGIRPEIIHRDSSKTLTVGRFLQRKELRYREEKHE